MSNEDWYNIKSAYQYALQTRLRHTYLVHMPWLIDQIIESRFTSFFATVSHMNLIVHPTIDLNPKHHRIAIYPKYSWFTLHYSYLDLEDIYTYDEYKVVLEDVKNILWQLMERLDKWRVKNLR
ncbi:MAG: hypothetical protein HWQ41_17880 [Nostoc sp. NOS(2021)]|uniref:hypothetical protein n=1 Tax=Nostoc sp. NOS(2021) TaxID=2815407 RepID=UPI0025D22820|nr:hypothetical protein [Nostoc sp. NOS(2021)]MBN3897071.1 hypothetical protein [Nostoc sp. NOS(2021)]